MKSIFIFAVLAATLPATFAQGGRDNGGRNSFRGGSSSSSADDRGPPRHDAPPSQGFPIEPGSFNQPTTLSTVAVPNTAPTEAAASASATPASGSGGSTSASSGNVDASLIPDYGVTPGVLLNDGTPRCAGDQGKPIDCDCPPDVDVLAAATADAVDAGADFPTGSSAADQLARLNTLIVVLQNVKGGPGSGVGCPVVATTWTELRQSLQAQA